MREVVAYFDPGGGGSKCVETFYQGSDTCDVVVLGGDVGTETQDGAGPD